MLTRVCVVLLPRAVNSTAQPWALVRLDAQLAALSALSAALSALAFLINLCFVLSQAVRLLTASSSRWVSPTGWSW